MFYFIASTLLTYNSILVAAAVIPALFLMLKVYKSDQLEKEPVSMLKKLVKAGILSSLLALFEEWVLTAILDSALDPSSLAYNIILYFVIVAGAEESSKYLFLKRNSWDSPEFNSQFDGVVYAVFVSLGFALWENISYVMSYGFSTALLRACTAIPGHACFGVFMGIFYGIAKNLDRQGKAVASKFCRIMAFVIPAVTHGMYDFIATFDQGNGVFLVFIAILFVVCYILVQKMSKYDKAI